MATYPSGGGSWVPSQDQVVTGAWTFGTSTTTPTVDFTNATVKGLVPGDLALTSGNIFVGSASNLAVGVPLSGDATIVASGAMTIGAGAVTASKIASATITTTQIAAGAVNLATQVTGAVPSANIDPQFGQFVQVNLSAAQIITLHSVPVSLIAAPGAGKAIVIDSLVFSMTFNSVQFTGGGAISSQYHGVATNLLNSTVLNTSVQGAASFAVQLIAAATTNGNNVFAGANLGVDLIAAGADFAAGNSTAKVFVWYSVVTL